MPEENHSPDTVLQESIREITVDPEMPVFRGHFPGTPLVPAAMLLDWMLSSLPGGCNPDSAWTVLQAKFSRAVLPGDRIIILCKTDGETHTVTVSSEKGLHSKAKFRRNK